MLRLYLYARVRVLIRKLHTRPRVQRAPGLPCALLSMGVTCLTADLGQCMSREGECVSTRHCERSDLPAVARRAKADTRDRLDHPHVAPLMRATVGAVRRRRGIWIDARLGRLPEPPQSGVAMTSFKMRMTGQQSDYFCLRVRIEMAMTYFRRTNSQEKSKEKKAKRRAGIAASPTR